MKFTIIHINALVIALVLAGVQGVVLYEVNGQLLEIIQTGRMDIIGVIFSPTAALVWALKHFSNRPPET